MKNKQITWQLLAVIAISFCAAAAIIFISRPKIGYVETQKIYEAFTLKKELEKNYHNIVAADGKLMDSLLMDFQLSGQRNADAHILNAKREYYLRKKEELQQKHDELNEKYTNQAWIQINQYVNDYGKKNGYDYILGANGSGSLMYASEGVNISSEVTRYINEKYEGR